MKKILAMILAMMLVLSMGVAFADDDEPTTYTDQATITITKHYKNANGGVSPEETFTFSAFTPVSIAENPAAEWPKKADETDDLPTITSITYAEGDATTDGTGSGTKAATITLPKYEAVGVYTYSFTEVTPATPTAGVTYNSQTLYLVVTVIEQNGKVRVGAVHCEGNSTAGTYGKDPKTDVFENTYESGTLAVSKSVTGNLGDKSKYFTVTVTFTAEGEEEIKSTITYTGGKYEGTQTVTGNSAEIQLKDGDTVTFANIPEGVTWTVAEDDYTAEADGGYDAAQYSQTTGTMTAGGTDTSTITNHKDTQIDTGVIMQYAPYAVVLALVLAGAAMMVIRRRPNED